MKRISFNVKDKRVEEVLDALPKGEMTQYITNCILERLEREEWSKGTVGKTYSLRILNEHVIKILEKLPKGERSQFITKSILCCIHYVKKRAKKRAEHKEVRIKVE